MDKLRKLLIKGWQQGGVKVVVLVILCIVGILSVYIPVNAVATVLAGVIGHGDQFNGGANYVEIMRFQASASGTANEIHVYGGYSNSNTKVALYSDNAGSPFNLLASSTGLLTSSIDNAITIANVPITVGTYYWIATIGESLNCCTYNQNMIGGIRRYKPMSYSTYSFPALWDDTGFVQDTALIYAYVMDNSATPSGSSNITSSGTANHYALFSSSTNLGNGALTQNGTVITAFNNITMSGKAINGLADPSLAQDVATKSYVDTHTGAGTGNVTESGSTSNYVPKFNSATNLINSSISDNGTWTIVADNISAKVGRGFTYVIATADATALEKAQADDVLTGTNDYIKIQADQDALTDFDSLKIVGRTVTLGDTGVIFSHYMLAIDMANIVTNYSGTGYAYTIQKTWATDYTTLSSADFGMVIATDNAVTGASAAGLCLNGCSYAKISIDVRQFRAGAGIVWLGNFASNYQVESNHFEIIRIISCKTGIKILGNYSTAYNEIKQLQYDMSTAGIANCVVIDAQSNIWNSVNDNIDILQITPNTVETISGFKGTGAIGWHINQLLVDGCGSHMGDSFLMWDNVSLSHTVDSAYFYTLATTARMWASGEIPYVNQFYIDDVPVHSIGSLATQLLRRDSFIPINFGATGDTSLNAGAGGWHGSTYTGTMAVTGTVPSLGGAYCENLLFDAYGSSAWTRYFELNFIVGRQGSDVNTVSRFQISPTANVTALSGHGLGIRIDNLNLVGISRGSGGAEESVALITPMSATNAYYISVRFYPGSRVEWWGGLSNTDLVLLGSQTDVAKIPSTSASARLCYGIITTSNPASSCALLLGAPYIWLERVP